MIKVIFVLLSIVSISPILGYYDETFYKTWQEKYREISENQNPPL